MIKALKSLFEMPPQESAAELQHRVQIVAAALLIETVRADFQEDASEEAALVTLLSSSLNLAGADIETLITEASARLDQATSLYEFTQLINAEYSAAQKLELIRAMWQVAFADGNLDKYEEHLIRQVAELTYVPHHDYIRTKLAVQNVGRD